MPISNQGTYRSKSIFEILWYCDLVFKSSKCAGRERVKRDLNNFEMYLWNDSTKTAEMHELNSEAQKQIIYRKMAILSLQFSQ